MRIRESERETERGGRESERANGDGEKVKQTGVCGNVLLCPIHSLISQDCRALLSLFPPFSQHLSDPEAGMHPGHLSNLDRRSLQHC